MREVTNLVSLRLTIAGVASGVYIFKPLIIEAQSRAVVAPNRYVVLFLHIIANNALSSSTSDTGNTTGVNHRDLLNEVPQRDSPNSSGTESRMTSEVGKKS
jgi:hypothetical protein